MSVITIVMVMVIGWRRGGRVGGGPARSVPPGALLGNALGGCLGTYWQPHGQSGRREGVLDR
eukprot:8128900-Pyramimonas_sp.AAC.1